MDDDDLGDLSAVMGDDYGHGTPHPAVPAMGSAPGGLLLHLLPCTCVWLFWNRERPGEGDASLFV